METKRTSFTILFAKFTSNFELLECARTSEQAFERQDYDEAILRAEAGVNLATNLGEPDIRGLFRYMMTYWLIEIQLIDVERAYAMGMKAEAREFGARCLTLSPVLGPSGQQITLMKLHDICEHHDSEECKRLQLLIMDHTIANLTKKE